MFINVAIIIYQENLIPENMKWFSLDTQLLCRLINILIFGDEVSGIWNDKFRSERKIKLSVREWDWNQNLIHVCVETPSTYSDVSMLGYRVVILHDVDLTKLMTEQINIVKDKMHWWGLEGNDTWFSTPIVMFLNYAVKIWRYEKIRLFGAAHGKAIIQCMKKQEPKASTTIINVFSVLYSMNGRIHCTHAIKMIWTDFVHSI